MTTFEDALRPRLFISYARADEIVRTLSAELAATGAAVWFDRHQISVGDEWRERIKDGILGSDEVLLMLSSSSAVSREVEVEIELAAQFGKPVRPIVLEGRPTDYPALAHLQMTTVTDLSLSEQLQKIRALLIGPDASVDDALASLEILDLLACRRLFPPYSARNKMPLIAPRLIELARRAQPASPATLNTGLCLCAAGEPKSGIGYLRAYANAAQNFAGWYFLALYALNGRSAANAPPDAIREAAQAVTRAVGNTERHPLTVALAATLAVGMNQRPVEWLQTVADEVNALRTQTRERADEYERAYALLRSSLEHFGKGGQALASALASGARQ